MKYKDFMFVQNLGLWLLMVMSLMGIMASCAIVLWAQTSSGVFLSVLCLLPLIHTIRSIHRDRYMHNYDNRENLWNRCEREESKRADGNDG